MTALTAEARARGLRGVLAAVPAGGTGDAFCLRRGLPRPRTLHHLVLSLRDARPGWLDELVAAEHPGYRLTGTAPVSRPGRADDALLTVAAEHGRKVVGCIEVVVPEGGGPRHDRPPADVHHGLGPDLWGKAAMLGLLHDGCPQAADGRPGFRLHHRTHEYRLGIVGGW